MAGKNNSKEDLEVYKQLLEITRRLNLEDRKGLDIAKEITRNMEKRRGYYYDASKHGTIFYNKMKSSLNDISESYRSQLELQKEIDSIRLKAYNTLGVEKDKVEELEKAIKTAKAAEEDIKNTEEAILSLQEQRNKLLGDRKYQNLAGEEREQYRLLKKKEDLAKEHLSDEKNILKESKKQREAIVKGNKVYKEIGENLEYAVDQSEKLTKSQEELGRKAQVAQKATEAYENSLRRSEKWGNVASDIFSSIGNIMGKIVDFAKDTAKYWIKVQDATFKANRSIGFSGEQLSKLNTQQLRFTRELAVQYGIAGEEILKLSNGFANATGRATVMPKEVVKSMAAVSKFSSDETLFSWQDQMDKLGISAKDTSEMMGLAELRAQKFGLNTSKATENIAKNLALANKYTFASGVDGITRMSLRAQALRVDMQNIMNSVDNFSDIEKAISNSANIQMLGGSYAANFSNPMQTLYESMNDPEALEKRIERTLQGKGKFDEKTGEVRLNGLDMQFIKQFGESSGIGGETAVQMAKSLTRNNVIDNQLGRGFSQSDKAAVENLAQYNSSKRQFEVYDYNSGKNISLKDLTPKKLKELQGTTIDEKTAYGDIHDISERIREYFPKLVDSKAKSAVSIQERAEGAKESWQAGLALVIDPYMKQLNGFIDKVINGKEGVISQIYNLLLQGKYKEALQTAGDAALDWAKKNPGKTAGIVGGAVGLGGLYLAKGYIHPIDWMRRSYARHQQNKVLRKEYNKAYEEAREAGFDKKSSKWLAESEKKLKKTELARDLRNATPNGAPAKGAGPKFLKNLTKIGKKGGKAALIAGATAAVLYGGYKLFGGKGSEEGQQPEGQQPEEGAVPTGQEPVNETINCDVCTELQKQTALLEKIAGVSPSDKNGGEKKREPGEGALDNTVVGKAASAAQWVPLIPGKKKLGKKLIQTAVEKGAPKGMMAKMGLNLVKGSRLANPLGWTSLAFTGADMAGQALGAWKPGSKTSKWLNVGSDATMGASIGSMFGGPVGTAIGGALGGAYGIANQFGDDIAKAFKKNFGDSKDSKESKLQLDAETKKINIGGGGNIYEKAAMATIGIHNLMISKFNLDNGKNANGGELTAKEEFKRGNIAKGIDKGASSLWGSIKDTFKAMFAGGGIVRKAAMGTIIPGDSYVGDKVPALLNSGEMVLNKGEQNTLFKMLSLGTLPIRAAAKEEFKRGGIVRKVAMGTIIPGDSYVGDKVPAMLNSGEMVLNKGEQNTLFKMLSLGIAPVKLAAKGVESLPIIGQAMHIVKQLGGGNLSIGKQSIDLNVSGTIKLDAGNGNTAMLDASKLLNDQRFISKIAELVSDAANRNVNAGKVVRSTSSKKGMYTPSSNRWGGVNQT